MNTEHIEYTITLEGDVPVGIIDEIYSRLYEIESRANDDWENILETMEDIDE